MQGKFGTAVDSGCHSFDTPSHPALNPSRPPPEGIPELRPVFSRAIRALACATSLFLAVFATLQSSSATANGSATATVNQLLATIGKLRTTTDPGERHRLVTSMDASLAIQKLSQQALGAQWSKLDSRERTHFVALVTQLLEKIAYPNAAGFFSSFQVKVLGEEAEGGQHIVRTLATRPDGGAVAIDYILEPTDGRWLIVDVILDRQSLVASMTSQIQATLKANSYRGLVGQMQERLAQNGVRPSP
jgi:ABC-type transporter MlaC component